MRALCFLASALLLSACSRQVVVPREALNPGESFSKSQVRTEDGLEYTFDRVSVESDSLRGEFEAEVQRQSAEHGVYYEDVVRTQMLGIDRITSISVRERDAGRTFFFGAGAFAVGMLLKTVFDSELSGSGGGGSRTKPDPNH